MARPRKVKGSPISIDPSNRGMLHEDLGVPEDTKIPSVKLSAAAHSATPAVRKRAVFAMNAKTWGK